VLLEQAGLLDGGEIPAAKLAQRFGRASGIRDATEWYERLMAGEAGSFFTSLSDRHRTVAVVRDFAPESARRVIDCADRLLEGRFDLLGYTDLSFGNPVQWHVDPVSGVHAPLQHWSRIPYLDPRVAGDHKVVWELNRHQFLVTLAQAYWLTGDERYAVRTVALLEGWMSANAPKAGINWASGLEIAYRAIAWLWTLRLLAGSKHLRRDVAVRALGFLYLSGRHVLRHLSRWFSPNTHLTGEALGLYYLGTQLPMFREAAAWREQGSAILLEQLPRQVHPDGTYFEQSTWYHLYTHDIYLHFLLLAERNGLNVRAIVGPVVERMVEHLAALTRPDGSMPLIGDDDGGRLLCLEGAAAGNLRDPLTTGAVLFARGDFAALATPPCGTAVWLLGPEAATRFAAVPPRPPASRAFLFRDGGVVVARDGWGPSASVLVIDAGPHGVLRGGHSHADALGFDLVVGGHPVLVDPGTFTYTGSAEWRDRFRDTAAHNCVTVDGAAAAVPAGPFSWHSIADGTISLWQPTDDADLFVGRHDGFERLAAPVGYERSVLFARDGYWLLCDRIESAGHHDVWSHLQCAPGLTVAREAGGVLRLRDEHADRLTIHVTGDARIEIEEGWVSPAYGTRLPATRCRYGGPLAGGRWLVSVLVDARRPRRVEAIDDDRGRTIRVTDGRWSDLIRVSHGAGPLREADVETDARLFWLRRGPDGEPHAYFAVGATVVRIDGVEVGRSDRPELLHGLLIAATQGGR
jgi:hypothetical protein